MLRKVLAGSLLLAGCALVLVLFDGVRHARALKRLAANRVDFGSLWRYRLSRTAAPDPRKGHGRVLEWLGFMVSTPRDCSVHASSTLDPFVARDLALTGEEILNINLGRQISPAVVTELCASSSIQILMIVNSGLTNEELNLLWSGMRELQDLNVESDQIEEDGFRDITRARNLSVLYLEGPNIDDGVIARVGVAQHLRKMDLIGTKVTEESASRLASMPALRFVSLGGGANDARLARKLRKLNPRLFVLGP